VDEIAREKNVDPATIEIWFADEARIGLKNKITRRWALARRASERPERPANRLPIHLRCDLPQGRQRRRARHAAMRYRSDEPTPGRNRHPDRARRACGAPGRSGRLASFGPADRAAQHHDRSVAAKYRELNSQENVWQFLRETAQTGSSNPSTISSTTAATHGTNPSIRPRRIMSICLRDWAYGF
jgi:hypothetical protein